MDDILNKETLREYVLAFDDAWKEVESAWSTFIATYSQKSLETEKLDPFQRAHCVQLLQAMKKFVSVLKESKLPLSEEESLKQMLDRVYGFSH